MKSDLKRLPAHLGHREGPLFLAWVPADEWADFLPAIRLAGAEYAAFPVEHYGWLVLTTARLRGRNVRDIGGEREHWLQDFYQKLSSEFMLCSPGWSDDPVATDDTAAHRTPGPTRGSPSLRKPAGEAAN
jgi:hypothetical protein